MNIITIKLTLVAVVLLLSATVFAAGVAINDTGDQPDASAMLDVQSSSKGFLPPRMTEAERLAIASPATGLMVYQTTGTVGLYYFDGSVWKDVAIVN